MKKIKAVVAAPFEALRWLLLAVASVAVWLAAAAKDAAKWLRN